MSTLNLSRGLATALLFVVGLCALAAAPPEARSATVNSITSRAAVLAVEELTWDGFVKFWKRQVNKTSGVVGVVALVGLGAMLLIMSKGRYGS